MSGNLIVRDYMSSPVASIPVGATLLDAALMLRGNGFRHLPVVDGERLVGVITERDMHRLSPSLLSNISAEEYNAVFENTPLEKVMTRDPVTTTPDAPLHRVAQILFDKKLGCLPVIAEGRLVGIITATDLLGVLIKLLDAVPAPAK
jgi:acetoin utilization protein AcuB